METKNHEEFYNLLSDNKMIIEFLIKKRLCSKRSVCKNLKCEKLKENVLTV